MVQVIGYKNLSEYIWVCFLETGVFPNKFLFPNKS